MLKLLLCVRASSLLSLVFLISRFILRVEDVMTAVLRLPLQFVLTDFSKKDKISSKNYLTFWESFVATGFLQVILFTTYSLFFVSYIFYSFYAQGWFFPDCLSVLFSAFFNYTKKMFKKYAILKKKTHYD